MHGKITDEITEGELHYLGLSPDFEETPYFASYRYRLCPPMSALEMALRMEERLAFGTSE